MERTIDTGTGDLLCDVRERVARVTLNRPQAKNALSVPMREALHGLVPRLGADPEVGCLLLTGAGGAFCAGGDTRKMADDGKLPDPGERLAFLRREHETVAALHELPKPALAALPGAAAGAGLGLALACDLRIAAERAFVTTAYVRLGLSGDYGVVWFLTRLCGTARARELMWSGARVAARECERIGLLNRVVPDAELESQAFAWARELAAGPPLALAAMKRDLNGALADDLRSCLEREAEQMVASAQTEDYVEAVRAFAEKRPPVFRGR